MRQAHMVQIYEVGKLSHPVHHDVHVMVHVLSGTCEA